MSTAAITFAVCLLLASAAMFLHAALQLRTKARGLAERLSAAAAQEASRKPAANPWHALPGDVLELGASGFQIRLTATPSAHYFSLYSPDGLRCASGWDMDAIKALGERLAGWRAELGAMAPLHQPFTHP